MPLFLGSQLARETPQERQTTAANPPSPVPFDVATTLRSNSTITP
jgi:hypothetical protein